MVRRIVLSWLVAATIGVTAQPLSSFVSQLSDVLTQPCKYEPWARADNNFWRDSIPATLRQSYIEQGRQYLGKPWTVLPVSLFAEFKESGRRVNYESACFEKRRHLAVLAMAEIMEGKGTFLPDIIDGIGSFCEETWWGIPAHYNKKVPTSRDQTVDLFNAETASLVAWTTYMLRPQLDAFSPLLARRVDGEIQRRILEPALKDNYWWKSAGMNWNPWICSNWLTCVLLCEPDRARQLEAVGQILKGTEAFIDSYPTDGGCDEGPGYWDRAAASMFEVLYSLFSATGGHIDLRHDAKVQAMAAYVYKTYIGHGYCTTFADTHSNKAELQPSVLFPFGQFVADCHMTGMAAYAARQQQFLTQAGQLFRDSHNFPSMARELLLLSKISDFIGEQPREPLLRQVWLPDLQVMTCRQREGTTNGLFLAMKGGHNGESHNHNDVGEFLVYADGKPLLIDPGVGEYTAKTFSVERYTIWTMQSQYHNLPQINGIDQKNGRQYAAQAVACSGRRMTLDLAAAYPEKAAVKSWRRTAELKGGTVRVSEDYELTAIKAPSRLMFITPVQPVLLQPGRLTLGTHQLAFNAHQLQPTIEDISPLLDPLLQSVWGPQLYRIVFTVTSTSLKGTISYTIK